MRKRIVRTLLGDARRPRDRRLRAANPGASPSDLYFLIASDYRYSGPVMKIAERRAALGKGPVYLYYFRWETPVDGGRLKSPHTIEIPFAFDNIKAATRLTGGGAEAHGAGRQGQRRLDRVCAHRQSEHAEAAAVAGVQRRRSADDGLQHAERGRERSDPRAAARHLQGDVVKRHHGGAKECQLRLDPLDVIFSKSPVQERC